MIVIDAHQHVWDPSRADYEWLGEHLAPINRAFTFDELQPSLQRTGVQATVLVQSADDEADTHLMLSTAKQWPQIAAVVAYAPLADASKMPEVAARFSENPLVVGVRNLIHNNPDPDWLLRPDVRRGLDALEAENLTFDLVSVLPRHLELVGELSVRHPKLRIVIDHLSKPPVGLQDAEPWWTLIARASRNPLVYAKISGLYAASGDPAMWTVDAMRPFIERAIEVFGTDRLMYGGDWPVCLTAGGYDRMWEALAEILSELPASDRERILGGTAASFYQIDAGLLRQAQKASAHSAATLCEPV